MDDFPETTTFGEVCREKSEKGNMHNRTGLTTTRSARSVYLGGSGSHNVSTPGCNLLLQLAHVRLYQNQQANLWHFDERERVQICLGSGFAMHAKTCVPLINTFLPLRWQVALCNEYVRAIKVAPGAHSVKNPANIKKEAYRDGMDT